MNLSSYLYTKATQAKTSKFEYTNDAKEKMDGSSVTVTDEKTSLLGTVIFNPDATAYQILKDFRGKPDTRIVIQDITKKPEIVDKPVLATMRNKTWTPIKADLSADGAKELFAKNVVEQAINYKPIRLVRWSALSVISLGSSAYNHPNSGQAAKWGIATIVVLAGIALYHWRTTACVTATTTTMTFADNTPVNKIWIPVARFFGFN